MRSGPTIRLLEVKYDPATHQPLSRMRDKANDHIKLNGEPSVTAEREVEFAQIELQEVRHLAEVVDRMMRAMGAARAALTHSPEQGLVSRIDKVLLQMERIP